MKIGIIGAGAVGSATAFALVMRNIARKIVLVDMNEKKAKAEAYDIGHATPFLNANKIKAGAYSDLKGCEIVIITAGANQKEGETRIDLLERNYKIFEGIIPQIKQHAPNCILIVTTNPADIMTAVALKLSGFDKNKVIGSGTVLDSARFKTLLGYHLGISSRSVHAYVLGEHGDSEVLAWSSANAANAPLQEVAKELNKPITQAIKEKIDDSVRNSAYEIIEGKGATNYGIAGALARICQAIASNEYAILTVSSMHSSVCDINDVCLSLPTVVGKRGIHQVIVPHLNIEENKALKQSATLIKEYTNKILKQ